MKVYRAEKGVAWPAVVVILALVAFGVYFFFRSMAQMKAMEREAAAPPAAETARPARAEVPASASQTTGAYGMRLKDLQGRAVSMEDFKGKPVFVTFWATWCRFCIGELPSIQKLYDSMKGEDVAFLLISSEDGAKVKPFLKKNPISVPILLQDGALPALYRTEGIPATFILDKKGNIARKQVGAMDWDSNEVRKFLKDLAKS